MSTVFPPEIIEIIYEFVSDEDKNLMIPMSDFLISNTKADADLFIEMYNNKYFNVTDYWVSHFDKCMNYIPKMYYTKLQTNIIDKRLMYYYLQFKKNGMKLCIKDTLRLRIDNDILKILDTNYEIIKSNLKFYEKDIHKLFDNCPNIIMRINNNHFVFYCKEYKNIVNKICGGYPLMPLMIYIADDLEYFKMAKMNNYAYDIGRIIALSAYKILEYIIKIDKITTNADDVTPKIFEILMANTSVIDTNQYGEEYLLIAIKYNNLKIIDKIMELNMQKHNYLIPFKYQEYYNLTSFDEKNYDNSLLCLYRDPFKKQFIRFVMKAFCINWLLYNITDKEILIEIINEYNQ